MTYENIIDLTDRYLQSEGGLPVLIDLPNVDLLHKIHEHYNVGKNTITDIGDKYCNGDNFPRFEDLYHDLTEVKPGDNLFINGITPYLLLQGEEYLKRTLRTLLDISCHGHAVIFTMDCYKYIKNFDERLYDSNRIMIPQGEHNKAPKLVFVDRDLDGHEDWLHGLNKLSEYYHSVNVPKDIYILTDQKKSNFPGSLLNITELTSSLQILKHRFSDLSKLDEKMGTEKQWSKLFSSLRNEEISWHDYIENKIGNPNNLALAFNGLDTSDRFTLWTYFLALYTFGAGTDGYLSKVVAKAETFDKFVKSLFDTILDIEPTDADFEDLYESRKKIISKMKGYVEQLGNFCSKVRLKKKNAILYLTDTTLEEKELTISLICVYANDYDKDELITILERVYPDLAMYLKPFDYCNDYLNKYFDLYKYCKVTNQILPEFIKMVEQQSTEHKILTWLQPRSIYIDNLDKDPKTTKLYFMDAMGAEYLAYVQQKCSDNKLNMEANVAICDLPSITSINKTFVKEFKDKGIEVVENKDLDDLKHEGQSSYDYQRNKYPIHIVTELEIISNLVDELRKIEANKTAYIIADHGTSRMSVVFGKENKWEVSQKGQHTGRCCPKSELDEKPKFAIEDNGYWCLANYDRFKGGRKAAVEVHGGASIEEMSVPIITISKTNRDIECSIIEDTPIIVSHRTNAKMHIFVNIDSDEISVLVDNKTFKAVKTNTKYEYKVEMPSIQKTGEYIFSICYKGGIIKQGLRFEVQKESGTENRYF